MTVALRALRATRFRRWWTDSFLTTVPMMWMRTRKFIMRAEVIGRKAKMCSWGQGSRTSDH